MLKGKTAIITGGTRGIGYGIAEVFLKNHAEVAIWGSREETVNNALEKLKLKYGDKVIGAWPNLTKYDDTKKAIDEVVNKFGKLDILVNNAGISARESLFDYKLEDFNKIMDLNVTAVFNTSKAAAEVMKDRGGSILNTSSMVSIYGQKSGVGYPASKFAVNGITKSLALELAEYDIRVNAVAPGVTRTDMVAALPQDMQDRLSASIPLKRMGEPEDIANAFLFLASDMASYISGVILSVDGLARN